MSAALVSATRLLLATLSSAELGAHKGSNVVNVDSTDGTSSARTQATIFFQKKKKFD